jgi:FMN phosphatase YigB (HAD superfamily)
MTNTISRPTVALLITDLDNTVWDWFAAWNASFAPMLAALAERSGVPQAVLEREIRLVHQLRGTSEYTLLLNELPSLRHRHGDHVDLMTEYDDVLHLQNSLRKKHTNLYPGVIATLEKVRAQGVPIVAYTESTAFRTVWRIKETGLDGLLDTLYSAPDHDWPVGLTPQDLRTLPAREYELQLTEHRHVPRGVVKPNDDVLRTILADYKVDPTDAVYIGDSLTKDIVMAQNVGVPDVHARYGVSDARPEYDLLRRVSHWPDESISREKDVAEGIQVVRPTYTVDRFDELLGLFNFAPRRDSA